MPTSVTLGSVSASICVDNQEVEVHHVQLVEETRTATCWIISETGKEYKVVLKKACPNAVDSALLVDTYIDGDAKRSRAMIMDIRRNVVETAGVRINESQLRPFVFSSLDTTGESGY